VTSQLEADRRRCLEAIASFQGAQISEAYTPHIQALIEWSLARPELMHQPNDGSQSVVRFVTVQDRRVFLTIYPGEHVDAKVVVLKGYHGISPILRDLRKAFEGLGGKADNGPTGYPTIRLGRLKSGSLRLVVIAMQKALDRTVTP
jgi:hypothetical protein